MNASLLSELTAGLLSHAAGEGASSRLGGVCGVGNVMVFLECRRKLEVPSDLQNQELDVASRKSSLLLSCEVVRGIVLKSLLGNGPHCSPGMLCLCSISQVAASRFLKSP